MRFSRPYSLRELSYFLNADLVLRYGSLSSCVNGLSDFFSYSSFDVIVFNNLNYLDYLMNINVGLIVLKSEYVCKTSMNCLVIDNPRLALAKLSSLCFNFDLFKGGIEKSVFVGLNTIVSDISKVCDNVVIGSNVEIKDNSFISPGSVIGNNCIIGSNCFLGSNVVLGDNVVIGNRSCIGSNSTIGGDGFGFVKNDFFGWEKINHFGGVVIGNDVDIGSNTSVDRGVFHNTIISDGVLIGNQVQIAHNVFVGRNTVMAGCIGVGGSTYIGSECLIGGGVMIRDHIFISHRVCVSGSSSVTRSINKSGFYSSVFPVTNSYNWNKQLHYFYKLKDLFI